VSLKRPRAQPECCLPVSGLNGSALAHPGLMPSRSARALVTVVGVSRSAVRLGGDVPLRCYNEHRDVVKLFDRATSNSVMTADQALLFGSVRVRTTFKVKRVETVVKGSDVQARVFAFAVIMPGNNFARSERGLAIRFTHLFVGLYHGSLLRTRRGSLDLHSRT
jgi:hypothetical protein